MKVLLVVFAVVAAGLAERKSYNGYSVYHVTPTTDQQVGILKNVEKKEFFDFWTPVRSTLDGVDILVSPYAKDVFVEFLNTNNIPFEVKTKNVEEAFTAERFRQMFSPRTARGGMTFEKYERYDGIMNYVNQIAKDYPEIASANILGKSYEGRDIPLVKVTSGGSNKPGIFIDCGIHAREWMAPATCLYIIQELVENAENAKLYENVDWYIVPVLNPDGYEFTHTNDRLWRKTRSPGKKCKGVDGNRNFDFHWMEIGASDYECSDIFAGNVAFSESETTALKNFLEANKDTIKMYLTFHSYGQYILYPWGYTSALPDDEPELKSLGRSVNSAISSLRGTRYTIGTSTNVLYAAAGGSDDYAKGVVGIELSYTLELPGGRWGFDPPASEIKSVVKETWLGVKVFGEHVQKKFV